MTLYQTYEQEILKGMDISDNLIQHQIEGYERELGLPLEPLERIQDFLDEYNRVTEQNFNLRYYQLLALLFTECFLSDAAASGAPNEKNMLAYWMATGSGKTLVMHLNILQYLHHFCEKDDFRLQLFLTTPLAGLIQQHRRELEPYVRKLNEVYNNRLELTIDTTQALLQKPDDYFRLSDDENVQRLILVDEAHIGLSSKESSEFRKLRGRLNVGSSFLFEYSATFHNVAKELKAEYDKSIIYRYDYARFYSDGYGKDHFFKPIAADVVADADTEIRDNLNECFRVMEEKLQTFKNLHQSEETDIDLTYHRPLMAFMGHTVENPCKEGGNDEVSDIQKVLDFLAALTDAERQRFRSVFGGDIIGPLVVARNPDNNNELLLSYGEGEKWGMINVGDGLRFYNGIENGRIEKRAEAITTPRLRFENLDDEASPINVLIGSRKFAEGWNSYRLSVIDLVNLGSAKGNLIIQIFGRGVRLRGKGGDGKRRYLPHNPNYYLLRPNDREDDIRRLETLTVFSLRRSYLERFIEEVHAGGVPLLHTFKVPVKSTFFRLDASTSVSFEDYRGKLPIFKQKGNMDSGIKRVFIREGNIRYTYLEKQARLQSAPTATDSARIEKAARLKSAPTEAHSQHLQSKTTTTDSQRAQSKTTTDSARLEKQARLQSAPTATDSTRAQSALIGDSSSEKSGTIKGWRVQTLDYRTDRTRDIPNIIEDLRRVNDRYRRYLNRAGLAAVIHREAQKNQLQIYVDKRIPTIDDFLMLVTEIRYQKPAEDPVAWADRLNRRVVIDVIRKLRNRINAHINSANYVYEPLAREDFIYHYTVTKEFQTREAYEAFRAEVDNAREARENPESEIRKSLVLRLEKHHRHIYEPLLLAPGMSVQATDWEDGEIKVSPDRLNAGEKKFVKDLMAYLRRHAHNNRYEFYLMRNVGKIGIYLESDEGCYFPDFVLWAIDTTQEVTHVLFIDPKGQRDISDDTTREYHPKVRLARKSEDKTLVRLEKQLAAAQGGTFHLNSFILLRDSSELGNGQTAEWIAENMEDYHILRLNWHEKTEEGYTSRFSERKSYLEVMFERAGIAL